MSESNQRTTHRAWLGAMSIAILISMASSGWTSAPRREKTQTAYAAHNTDVERQRRINLERHQLEIILDEDLKRHHLRFMAQPRYAHLSYTDYWITQYENRLHNGRVMARVVAPVVADLHWKDNSGLSFGVDIEVNPGR